MTKAVASAYGGILKLYESLVHAVPGVVLKGATVPYTSVNGNMFSYLSKEGKLALRLPQDSREEFLTKYNESLCTSYGIVQKEYVEVPGALLAKTTSLKPYLAASLAYAKSLKAKGTASKKPK